MKTLNHFIILIIFVIATIFLSCEKLDIVRTMDTKTDDVEINSSAVVAYGTILDIGDSQIIQHGHCWSVTPEPTVDNNKTELGEISERDTFSSQLIKIIPGIEHFIRSYIYDGTNYVYGNTVSFTITSENINFVTDPIISLNEIKVRVNSSVDNIGSINFIDYGHCWSQTDPPTVDDNITSYGYIDTNQNFTSIINNLSLGRYYVRAYLESESGVIYSNTEIFESTISVITGIATSILDTEAVMHGTIRSLGVEPIRDHGHCWSTITSSPSLNDEYSSLGAISKLGTFSSELNNLLPGRKYYIRSYATDGIIVYYGEIKSFTTTN